MKILTPGDEALLRAACRAVGVEPGEGETFLADDDTMAVVAEVDGAPVGLAYGHRLLHPDGDITMLLYSLDVAEAARQHGHGLALVEAFVAEARRRGCKEVWVLTDDDNAAAQATYRAAGAKRDGDQAMFSWQLVD